MSRVVDVSDGKWYLDKFDEHHCCDCHAVHDVSFKVENGQIFTRWRYNERRTRTERRRHGIKITKPSA